MRSVADTGSHRPGRRSWPSLPAARTARTLSDVLVVAVLVAVFAAAPARAQQPTCAELTCEFLRNRIEMAGVPVRIEIAGDAIYATETLPLFYERRGYRPAWVGDLGLLPRVDSLVRAIRSAESEGLASCDYHIAAIEAVLPNVRKEEERGRPDPQEYVELELLLTDAFLVYGSHLLHGKTDPVEVDAEWHVSGRGNDLAAVLESALRRFEAGEVESALQSLLPERSGYGRLRDALARYRRLAEGGGWPELPPGETLGKDDVDERVVLLRERLAVEGYLPDSAGGDHFDSELEEAVVRFQEHRGLDADGRIGKGTLAALNVPAWDRVRQIEVNLERWRWLPLELGERFAVVNIANFQLYVVEGEDVVLDMRVVVGKDYRRTPVFSDEIRYLVFAPYWNVPRSIAVKDMLPKIRKDVTYLEKERFTVLTGWGPDTEEVEPRMVDWDAMTQENLPYRFRQEPGTNNALGRVKFMFPNEFSVYLHDTPAKALFSRNVRTFSSGCIRVERPVQLAEYLLAGDPSWTREDILTAMDGDAEKTVRLPEPVPVHILYWTAWADEDGSVQFRNDIYERDIPLDNACDAPAPAI